MESFQTLDNRQGRPLNLKRKKTNEVSAVISAIDYLVRVSRTQSRQCMPKETPAASVEKTDDQSAETKNTRICDSRDIQESSWVFENGCKYLEIQQHT